ncbi:MAG: glucosyl hydrolase [Candidatus Bathyarchaeia archaeon]
MRWRKIGRVYVASREYGWAQTHAYVPTPLILDDCIRIYVAFLDANSVGRIGYVDVDKEDPLKILEVSENPALDVGKPKTFDAHGVTPMCILRNGKKLLLYYTGWQRNPAYNLRYTLFTGLALSEDGERFKRFIDKPILESSDHERYIRSAACVIKEGNTHKMWYVAGSRWINVKGKLVPTYNLRYMESMFAHKWAEKGIACIDFANEDEYGFGRPWVIREGNIYKMWYSIRTISKGYRIGYAESKDGVNWIRKDNEVGIDVSKEGWDSEMICFSAVADIDGKRYMFYNGNDFGKTGFGVAMLE